MKSTGHIACTDATRTIPKEIVQSLGQRDWEKSPTVRLDKGVNETAMYRDMASGKLRFLDQMGQTAHAYVVLGWLPKEGISLPWAYDDKLEGDVTLARNTLLAHDLINGDEAPHYLLVATYG